MTPRQVNPCNLPKEHSRFGAVPLSQSLEVLVHRRLECIPSLPVEIGHKFRVLDKSLKAPRVQQR